MSGTELVYNLFSECVRGGSNHEGLCPLHPTAAAWELSQSIGIALVVKGVLTIVTFGIKLPAGIFIPTLGVGACFGRILGIAVQYMQLKSPELPIFGACKGNADCIIPGLYAMVCKRIIRVKLIYIYSWMAFRWVQQRRSQELPYGSFNCQLHNLLLTSIP